jgi:hypothetical protein
MQNLHFLEYSAEVLVSCSPLSILASPGRVLPGPPRIDNGAYGTEKLQVNTQVTEHLHSEPNLLIYYTYVWQLRNMWIHYITLKIYKPLVSCSFIYCAMEIKFSTTNHYCPYSKPSYSWLFFRHKMGFHSMLYLLRHHAIYLLNRKWRWIECKWTGYFLLDFKKWISAHLRLYIFE